MRSAKKRFRHLVPLGGAIVLGLLIVSILVFYPRPAHPIAQIIPSSAQPTVPQAVNRGLPALLTIPKLKVAAKVLYMGLTKTGAMDTPNNVVDVGWYKYGPLPGNLGSAVIAGHIDGLSGQPGVFSNLGNLQPGDTLSITDSQGHVTAFVVRAAQTYDGDSQPSEVFTSSSGAHLNLISCTGAWDATQHQFQKRLVVFTDQVD